MMLILKNLLSIAFIYLRICVRAVLLAYLFISIAHALPEDKEKNIELTADLVEYDQKTGVGTYTGNVVVIQGTMEIKANLAKMYIVNGEFNKVEAFGKPIKMKYLPEATKPMINGEGEELVYLPTTGLITVSKNAKFKQGSDSFVGDKVEYNVQNGNIKAIGSGNGKEQVKFIIQPQSKKK